MERMVRMDGEERIFGTQRILGLERMVLDLGILRMVWLV
jgi:hypothetical protein